ncbi:hypothetical protein RYZ20_10905 [Thioclava sp. A2]|uniref:hypothetical protein n=1 Tax=Thioclava sp. FCG-A2 TaxID=3080562 RepID=UPI0029550040|nr:hypothetical protein [Thioclava sp. A2]MDV7271409.1 hypothetical protein [Thioclava sp. A2]
MEAIALTYERLKRLPLPEGVLSRCEHISRKLDKLSPGQGKFLTLDFFASEGDQDVEVIQAVNLLCSQPNSPLRSGGYIVDEGEFVFLENEDFLETLRTGDLVHPETGELIRGGSNQVFLYFFIEPEGK